MGDIWVGGGVGEKRGVVEEWERMCGRGRGVEEGMDECRGEAICTGGGRSGR